MTVKTRLPEILQHHQTSLVSDWLARQHAMLGHRASDEREDREVAERFVKALGEASRGGNLADPDHSEWSPVRELLGELSRARARQGFSPSETATFVFSLKKPLFARLRQEVGKDPEALADETWAATRAARQAGPLHHRGPPEGSRGESSAGSSRRCSSSRRRSSSSGTASWRCR